MTSTGPAALRLGFLAAHGSESTPISGPPCADALLDMAYHFQLPGALHEGLGFGLGFGLGDYAGCSSRSGSSSINSSSSSSNSRNGPCEGKQRRQQRLCSAAVMSLFQERKKGAPVGGPGSFAFTARGGAPALEGEAVEKGLWDAMIDSPYFNEIVPSSYLDSLVEEDDDDDDDEYDEYDEDDEVGGVVDEGSGRRRLQKGAARKRTSERKRNRAKLSWEWRQRVASAALPFLLPPLPLLHRQGRRRRRPPPPR